MPNGIVAAVDLAAPNAPQVLEAHAAFANTRGIRQILNVHENKLFDYIGRHLMRDAAWRENFALLRRYDMSFDLQLYPSQMEEAAALARAHADTQFIINHAGMFVDRSSVAGYRAWRDGMRQLAGCANVAVKISGLAMFDHSGPWKACALMCWRRSIHSASSARCSRRIFRSTGCSARMRIFGTPMRRLSRMRAIAEKDALFCRNAERIYRI